VSVFDSVGRFDADFECHEDYELGVRLLAQRTVMRYVQAASGAHHERTTLPRAFARKREEGRADVLMLRKHPELAPELPLGFFDRYSTSLQRLLRRLAFERPFFGKTLAAALTRSLPLLEASRFRGRWKRRVDGLLSYWYWLGIREQLPTLASIARFLQECDSRSEWSPTILEVDVANGLQLVMAQVDRRRPEGLRVMLKEVLVGDIPPRAGAEGLRGEHLKAALARELAGALLEAMARTGAIPVVKGAERLVTTGEVPSEAARF
jgi:hypothetical protein